MSESEEETSGTDSPVIKSRAVPRNQSSSEEYDSDEEEEKEAEKSAEDGEAESEDENADESEQQPEIAEKVNVQPKIPVSSMPSSLAPKRQLAPPGAQLPIVKPKSYDTMVLDAMKALDENKRSGVSVISVSKYIKDNMLMRDNFKKALFKKAIDKALKSEMFVHTSGMGMSGSIAFSVAHKKTMKQEQNKKEKALKAAEKKATKAAEAKLKAKAKPKVKTTKEPPKDKNNNKTDKPAASKKPTAMAKKARLSIAIMPAAKAKAKPKPKAAAKAKPAASKATASKQTTTNAVASEVAGPNTKGRAKAAAPSKTTVAAKDKAGKAKK